VYDQEAAKVREKRSGACKHGFCSSCIEIIEADHDSYDNPRQLLMEVDFWNGTTTCTHFYFATAVFVLIGVEKMPTNVAKIAKCIFTSSSVLLFFNLEYTCLQHPVQSVGR